MKGRKLFFLLQNAILLKDAEMTLDTCPYQLHCIDSA